VGRFRKRPLEVEAVRVEGRWFREDVDQRTLDPPGNAHDVYIDRNWRMVYVRTPEGTMRAKVGDWLIRGVAGEVYPCADAVFRKTYEPAT